MERISTILDTDIEELTFSHMFLEQGGPYGECEDCDVLVSRIDMLDDSNGSFTRTVQSISEVKSGGKGGGRLQVSFLVVYQV